MAPLLAMHPGSGSERKNWPEVKWAVLIEHLLRSTPWDLLLIGGEAEGDRLQRLTKERLPRVELAESLPLPELASRLQTADAFIGHDSGISHLAAALDLPSLVLWGETNEFIWRPRNDRVRLLKPSGGLSSLEVERVAQEVRKLLPV